jgi:hypothetical protein
MMLFTTVVRAAEPAGEGVVSGGPEQREMWVPANRLKEILAKYPNAVVLSREQYETLVNDASEEKKPEKTAPRRAALTEARYEGRIAGKVVQVTAVLTVQVLEKEWAEVPLGFAGATVGTVNVDGEAALIPETPGFGARASTKANPATAPMALLLRGRGERKVTVEFTVPIAMEAGLNRLRLALPAAAASTFVLDLPANQRVESPQPISIIKVAAATKVTAALAPANPALELSWRGAGDAAQALEPLVLVNGIYTIDAEKVRGEFGFAVETQLGSLPVVFQIPLPANVKVLQVTGDELAQWAVANGKLAITLQAGERSTARFWLALEMPSLAAAPQATLAPPVPRIEGLARMQGVFSIVGDAGVTIERVTTDNTATLTDRAIDLLPYFVASYKFLTPPAGPQVTVERVQPRFSADLDTLVEFRRGDLHRAHADAAPGKGRRVFHGADAAGRRGSAERARRERHGTGLAHGGGEAAVALGRSRRTNREQSHGPRLQNPHADRAGEMDANGARGVEVCPGRCGHRWRGKSVGLYRAPGGSGIPAGSGGV